MRRAFRRAPIGPARLAGFLLALTGCASQQASLGDLPIVEMAGHFRGAPGASWFRACGAAPGDSAQWVTLTGHLVTQVDEARAAGRFESGGEYFVRWRAATTTGGEVGPRGSGAPALLVREILELRPAAPGDCSR